MRASPCVTNCNASPGPFAAPTAITPSANANRTSTVGSGCTRTRESKPTASPRVTSNTATLPGTTGSRSRVVIVKSRVRTASFPSITRGRRSRNRLPAAAPVPCRTDQSRSPMPATDTTSPSPVSPSVSTSGFPCTTRTESFASPLISVSPSFTICSAEAVKNNGASGGTPVASTTIFPPAPGVNSVVTGAACMRAWVKHARARIVARFNQEFVFIGDGELIGDF